MKKIILLLLIASSTFAQKNEIHVSVGMSRPMGTFGATSDDLNKDMSIKNGFAKKGLNINLGFTRWINKSIGVSLSCFNSTNAVDNGAKSAYSKTLYAIGKGSKDEVFFTEKWQNSATLVGVSLKASAGKISVIPSVQVGVGRIIKPLQSLEQNYPGIDPMIYDVPKVVFYKTAYSVSLQAQYGFTEKLSAGISMGYFGTGYKNQTIKYSYPNTSSTYSTKESRSIMLGSLSAGLTYIF